MVGLRDKYAKKIEEQGFRPIDLNEDNVQAIFNRCIATKDSVDFIGVTLFTKETGFSENSKQIVFDRKEILKNKSLSEISIGMYNRPLYSFF